MKLHQLKTKENQLCYSENGWTVMGSQQSTFGFHFHELQLKKRKNQTVSEAQSEDPIWKLTCIYIGDTPEGSPRPTTDMPFKSMLIVGGRMSIPSEKCNQTVKG
jgi:hypothetical protein